MSQEFTKYEIDDYSYQEIDEQLKKLLELCQIYHLPMFACVSVKNDSNETKYDSVVYSPQAHQINLKDDRIRKCMLVANGFETVPPRDSFNLNMDEFSEFLAE